MSPSLDSFGSRSILRVGDRDYTIYNLAALERAGAGHVSRLPFSLRILLENLVRNEDNLTVTRADIAALASWDPANKEEREVAFRPARVLMQDFTGVPGVVDLAAMRDAMAELGGDPAKINPLQPAELVVDHSVQVDEYGTRAAFMRNARLENERNSERYALLRWGQEALDNLKVVPPDTGIVHQVNLENLARVVFPMQAGDEWIAYPDSVIGTDSHTTMINGLGVLGWGVGGIEAEASLLGQPSPMLIPEVVGFRLIGELREGATATDLVLTVTELLRKKSVVGKFVEFFGPGLSNLPLTDRATIANMAPEYGATMGYFPVDAETLTYLRFTGRDESLVQLVEAYCKEQGLFRTDSTPEPIFSDTLQLDLGSVVPSIAGPRRPQDRVALTDVKQNWRENLGSMLDSIAHPDNQVMRSWTAAAGAAGPFPFQSRVTEKGLELSHGAVVIAAITSCTNTSNPQVMMAAGLLARNAVARGLKSKPWVKTSLAPGSQVVTEYLGKAGLMSDLEALGFYLVGYGCTTCIGNSGPLPDAVSSAISDDDLVVGAVLSGNRNFEGRIHAQIRANYLASPPLVVAFALAGTMDTDFDTEPLGTDRDGKPVFLRDIWPSRMEIEETVRASLTPEMFKDIYADVFTGDAEWRDMKVPQGVRYDWDPDSTYIRKPPYFDGMKLEPAPLQDIHGARVLVMLGDSVTTDHISPAGEITADGPAGQYLMEHGEAPRESRSSGPGADPGLAADMPRREATDFNTFGARRGNHEVMARGTFANVRLKNALVPGIEGGFTRHLPDGERTTIWDASERYQRDGIPSIVLAGKEYGTGSSRDWAAKGPKLLGIKAVIVESFERIHRSNLLGMGVLPLQFEPGDSIDSLGLNGEEVFEIEGISEGLTPGKRLSVRATAADGSVKSFNVITRIDTPIEVEYYKHDGILPYVLRQLIKR